MRSEDPSKKKQGIAFEATKEGEEEFGNVTRKFKHFNQNKGEISNQKEYDFVCFKCRNPRYINSDFLTNIDSR